MQGILSNMERNVNLISQTLIESAEQCTTTCQINTIVHDIGIRLCLEKYGDGNGKLQEKEGPALAEQMLSELGFEKDVIERVSFLVGHHHTYTGIDGLDYQILVEADFLVNLFEGNTDTAHIRATYDNIFRTETGKKICREMFGL